MRSIFLFVILIPYAFASIDKLLHYITDEVPGGSYKYYSLTYEGFIKIILTSDTVLRREEAEKLYGPNSRSLLADLITSPNTDNGDADLYASQITSKPTYEPNQYCLQSATCGEDSLLIPDSFKRPVSIGVYGHPSHENSRYILLVYETTDTENVSYERNSGNIQNNYDDKEHNASVPTSIIWYLLDFLFVILF